MNDSMKIEPEAYRALALQTTCYAVNGLSKRTDVAAAYAETLHRIDRQIYASIAFIGPDVRLVVLPEYFLSGFPLGESIPAWLEKACLDMKGPEYDQMGAIAEKHGIFLTGNAYEKDSHFPDLYFQTCFVIDPSGAVILRYRRLNSMYAPTPHDVWDRYLDRYGLDGVFPVVDTKIGRLGALASEEILYPELARCLCLRGAEVLLHPTSEIYSKQATPKDICKQARAIENMAYVISSNSAAISNTPIPASSTDGGSKIIDPRGLILAEAGPGESMSAFAEIDIAALRRMRRRPGMTNYLARQRLEVVRDTYAQTIYPANSLTRVEAGRGHFVDTQKKVIRTLIERGML